MRFFVLIFAIFISSNLEARRDKRIAVSEPVKAQINNVIEQAYKLQQSLYNKKEPAIITGMQSLKFALQKAQRATVGETIQGPHIQKILKAAMSHVQEAQTQQSRNDKLKDAYKQVVVLYESYSTLKEYKVYFCRSDRSVWIQKAHKTQNPFNPSSRCGKAT